MLEYGPDQIKIVDFLLLAKFWACLLFFCSPSRLVHTISNFSFEFENVLEGGEKKSRQARNLANSKKSTILI